MPRLTSKFIQRELTKLMEPTLESQGYQKIRSGLFINEIPDVQRIIGVACFFSRGVYRITLGFRVRFPAVEQVFREGQGDPDLRGTFGGLAKHVLGSGEGDWICHNQTEIPSIADRLLVVCKDGIAFLESNSSMEMVRKRIAAKSPPRYTAQDEACVLAAMDTVDGHTTGALTRLDDFIAARKDEVPGKWRFAKELRDYIADAMPKQP